MKIKKEKGTKEFVIKRKFKFKDYKNWLKSNSTWKWNKLTRDKKVNTESFRERND